ncbi:hypothetical protein DITRI_Ditri11bG0059000 [Diplodiscus trichospermus]
MEARRLAILFSHLCPLRSGSVPARSSTVYASGCSSERQLVLDSNREISRNDCVFCQIICGESPALKLYEDDNCLCILDTSPLSLGHSLIIPKSHFSSLDTTPPSVVAAMCSKVPFIGNAIMKATGSDSFNLLVNNGAAAGQVIFHSLHRHPVKLDQETSGLANRVRELLLNISEESKDQVSSMS